MLTCTECLRSFPLGVTEETLQTIQETECLYCPSTVRYVIDFSRSVTSPPQARRIQGCHGQQEKDGRVSLSCRHRGLTEG